MTRRLLGWVLAALGVALTVCGAVMLVRLYQSAHVEVEYLFLPVAFFLFAFFFLRSGLKRIARP